MKSEKLQKWQNKVDEKWRWPNWRSLHCVFPSSPCFGWAFIGFGVCINFRFCLYKCSPILSLQIIVSKNNQHILNTPHLRFHEKQIHMMQFQQCIILHVVPSQIAVMHLRHICASHTRRPRSSLEPLCSPSISLKISASKSTSLSPILLLPQILSLYICCHGGSRI